MVENWAANAGDIKDFNPWVGNDSCFLLYSKLPEDRDPALIVSGTLVGIKKHF